MHKNIIFIACMIYKEDIVIRRPMTFHNYNTCTSLLQYTRTHTYTNIKTSDLYVNEWAVKEGGGVWVVIFSCNLIPYDYG